MSLTIRTRDMSKEMMSKIGDLCSFQQIKTHLNVQIPRNLFLPTYKAEGEENKICLFFNEEFSDILQGWHGLNAGSFYHAELRARDGKTLLILQNKKHHVNCRSTSCSRSWSGLILSADRTTGFYPAVGKYLIKQKMLIIFSFLLKRVEHLWKCVEEEKKKKTLHNCCRRNPLKAMKSYLPILHGSLWFSPPRHRSSSNYCPKCLHLFEVQLLK